MTTDRLNIEVINLKLRDLGLSQSNIADKLSVSREAVSKWFNGETFPRPKLLLQLAGVLSLTFEQIVLIDKTREPVVAFRKMRRTKIQETDNQRAKEMGVMLKRVAPYLTKSNLSQPSVLKEPINDYEYIQAAANEVRIKINATNEMISYDDLISFFYDLNATLIPVLWGSTGRHENALHIYLPDSESTWVYLNLDTNIIDFKFWMAHELGHIKAPQLRGNDWEDFADRFAGALLFPGIYAAQAYTELHKIKNPGTVVNQIKLIAERFNISPISVYKEINTYVSAMKIPSIDIDQKIFYGACANHQKNHQLVSSIIFSQKYPTTQEFMEKVASIFKTDFYYALGRCIKNEKNGSGFVQRVLDIPALDARELYDFLVKAE